MLVVTAWRILPAMNRIIGGFTQLQVSLPYINMAFICMNLPYTMTVERAASAVLEFKPKVVSPYHYKGSDVEKFKQLVSEDKDIEVRLLKWY